MLRGSTNDEFAEAQERGGVAQPSPTAGNGGAMKRVNVFAFNFDAVEKSK
jgi:hypothetical protein